MTMDFTTAYRGTTNGSIQTTYTDQPGKAYAGLLMSAGEPSAVDSYIVGETLGDEFGDGFQVACGLQGAQSALKLRCCLCRCRHDHACFDHLCKILLCKRVLYYQ